MARKPTASDVARRACVSRSTVSLVLAGRGKEARLSEATQARVLKAAEELHYKPNAAGRSLVKGRTETIGLVIRDLALLNVDPYLLPLLNGILQRARKDGYNVLVESARGAEHGDAFGDLMDSGRIDGIIVENADFPDKSLQRLIKAGRPVVVLGSQGVAEEFSVAVDDRQIGYRATHHLAALGRRRIAHIAYSSAGIFTVDERFRGYREALKNAGLRYESALVRHANFSMESGYEAMQDLLSGKKLPDAVFTSSDAVAIGALAAIHDAGLRVPQDLAVASVDDINAASFSRPSLTTVTSEPHASGEAAADMLIDLMSGRVPKVRNVLIDPRLIVRGSTDEGYVEARPSTPTQGSELLPTRITTGVAGGTP